MCVAPPEVNSRHIKDKHLVGNIWAFLMMCLFTESHSVSVHTGHWACKKSPLHPVYANTQTVSRKNRVERLSRERFHKFCQNCWVCFFNTLFSQLVNSEAGQACY